VEARICHPLDPNQIVRLPPVEGAKRFDEVIEEPSYLVG
jgi:hypothetical protein